MFHNSLQFNRNSRGGEFLLYICKDILSNFLAYKFNCDIETLSVEVFFLMLFLHGSYDLNKGQVTHHFEYLKCLLDECSKEYENFLFFGDLNCVLEIYVI